MTRKRCLISLIPILGSIIYTFYLFLTDIAGMLSFVAVYLPFALICNATSLDLVRYQWLLILMFIISGILWNIVYFLILNLIEKNKN